MTIQVLLSDAIEHNESICYVLRVPHPLILSGTHDCNSRIHTLSFHTATKLHDGLDDGGVAVRRGVHGMMIVVWTRNIMTLPGTRTLTWQWCWVSYAAYY